MAQIKAIETRYAGCRFRSRLEARWAVAFDHLGIQWEYEPQGVMVSNRLGLEGLPPTCGWGSFGVEEIERWPYLPDFWLPDHEVWAEVKGSLTPPEACRLLTAAASLSSNDGVGCHDDGGHDVVILGPIPTPRGGNSSAPWRLHMCKGILLASPWPQGRPGSGETVASDTGEVNPEFLWGSLLEGYAGFDDGPFHHAYTAARSARFEHGERG